MTPTNTIVVPAPAQTSSPTLCGKTSPWTQHPRAAVNAGVHSMLAAAIGLTSLSTPSSPSKASPIPSTGGVKDATTQASAGPVDVADNAPRATRDIDKSLFMNNKIIKPSPALSNVLRPAIKEMITAATPQLRPAAMAMMAPPPARPPAHRHLNILPSYPALTVAEAAARPSALKRSAPWSLPIRTSPAGFDTRHMSLNPHSAPLSNAATAMDCFSVGERIATMDRAAAAAAFAAPPLPYDRYFPPYASLPPLPTPYQTTPHPNKKNFPETLFDVISSEEYAHIIAWLPHGEGFIIHDKQRFPSMILPRYFDGAKFTSFTRRLKRWCFVRVPCGPELGAYYNKNFVRGHLELVQKMRYRMDGQFEEGKEKSDDKNEENEKLEEQIEKEVESKVRVSLSNKEGRMKDSSPRLIGQANCKPHHNQVFPANIPNQEIKTLYLTNPQDRPMPLPSIFPRRPKAAKKTAMSIETLRNNPTTTVEFSSFPRGHPTLVRPNDPSKQQMMKMQRDLLMARSMMPHAVAPSGAIAPRSVMGSSSYYTTNSTAQRMRSVECAERILEAEHMLGQNHRSYTNSNDAFEKLRFSTTLPQRPKAVRKTVINHSLAAIEKLMSYPTTTTESSSLLRRYPSLVTPDDHDEQRLMEKQRELLLVRSMMSQKVASGAILGPTSSAARFTQGTLLSSHPCYTTASTTSTQRMLDTKRVKRILGQDDGRSSNSDNNPEQNIMPPEILASPKTHEEMMDVAMRDLRSRLVSPFTHLSRFPPQRSNNHENREVSSSITQRERQTMFLPMTNRLAKISQDKFRASQLINEQRTIGEGSRGGGGGRPIMMSREEEEEFARYLCLKRKASPA